MRQQVWLKVEFDDESTSVETLTEYLKTGTYHDSEVAVADLTKEVEDLREFIRNNYG